MERGLGAVFKAFGVEVVADADPPVLVILALPVGIELISVIEVTSSSPRSVDVISSSLESSEELSLLSSGWSAESVAEATKGLTVGSGTIEFQETFPPPMFWAGTRRGSKVRRRIERNFIVEADRYLSYCSVLLD